FLIDFAATFLAAGFLTTLFLVDLVAVFFAAAFFAAVFFFACAKELLLQFVFVICQPGMRLYLNQGS
ncbi:MAG: hypothetical protein OSA83_20180, partial [Pseudomonadales bacterium]|nr:hypothetical protein [Pseudomonadales bacterium]